MDAFGADLSSQAEVRRLAAEVLDAYPRLDVLVNNVGGSWATRHVTADGLEHTFALNHLAAFLLTNLLLDRLKASAPARIVTVSSGAQSLGKIDFEDLQGERNYSEQKAYPQSKLASVMFTYELARRLEGTGVTATVLHPGVVSTRFGVRGSLADLQGPRPVLQTVHEDTAAGCGDIDLAGVLAEGRGRHRDVLRQRQAADAPTRRRTTRAPQPACGRSAPASSASRQRRNPAHPAVPRAVRRTDGAQHTS